MKQCALIVLLLFISDAVLAQRAVPTKAVFVVKDDQGQPVENVSVDGGFADVSQSGARDRFNGLTDTNGMFVATGNAVLDVGARFRKNGYYSTIKTMPLGSKNRQKFDHWDVDVPVLLKCIRNPIPLFMNHIENPHVDLWESVGKYNLGRTSSYDVVLGSFLPPYGSGEVADFRFNWKMTIHSKDDDGLAVDYNTLCDIRTTNEVDGICKGDPDGVVGGEGSSYISTYEAPIAGYTSAMSFYRNVRGSNAESNDDQHYLYYFRIRTQTNGMGQVTNALYGKIYGQINGSFTYFLNPTPNDRNVEFDPKQNLFTDLGEFEQVHQP